MRMNNRGFMRLWNRQRGRCWCCRCWSYPFGLERHHVVPRSVGGPNTDANLMLLCEADHAAVHRESA